MNLLLTSAGRRNQLMGCFRQSAAALGLPLRVLAADLRPERSSACQSADAAFTVPPCQGDDYVEALLELCRREQVALLVPTIDTELPCLAAAAAQFEAIGTRVAVSSPEVVSLARDKQLTTAILAQAGIPTPRTAALRDYLDNPAQLTGPLIAKPRGGSSSIGLVYADGPDPLRRLDPAVYLVQERWVGEEFTVNMFFDRQGNLVTAVPHRRIQVRGGEVSQGVTVRNPWLIDTAGKLATALVGARAALCFQAIMRPDGTGCVFEINARFGGGYPLAHAAGATFTQWLLEEATGRPSTAHGRWESDLLMLRYDEACFIRSSVGR